ncbi:acyl-CoA dehydrogenase family protein [Donghicola eburneus]|uniref:acyl-CoA dehydrogenase family protein n=1 Tax=Donghicola eburneus TaxID=393278 RepID=UPI0008E49443|nr:acyl-CoA dehydrogenase family protein [Donghicola eburneus]SFQ07582.1 hypothetical protein SAMN05421764_101320 [Donghicola eburneus]
MVPFAAPVDDILFSLRKVADVDRLPDWDNELAEGVITHFASFAEGVIAPLDESGDAQGCRLENGRVRMPDGFGDAYSQLAEGGWQGLTAPEQFGGMQADHVTAACVSEIFSGANHSMQMVCNLVPGAISTLMRFGTEDQKSAYIPPLAEGRWLATMCLTEPGAGSDLGRVRTKAVQDGDHYKITGEKIFISGGDQDMSEGIFHLVLARTGAMEDGVKGLSLFLCLSENDGIRNDITVTRIEEKLGLHASPTCQMSFDGARAELVGAEGQGLMAMFTMMNHARIDVSLQGVAHASRAYQVASTYAADRTQGRKSDGSPAVLSDHPDVRRMLDEQRMLALGARAMVHVAMVEMDLDARPALVDFLTPVCKVFCTDAGTLSADLGMQILGGYGYLTEYRVSQTWRDARICSIYEGANGIHDLTIATRGLKLPGAADGFDDLIGELTDDAVVLAIRDTWRAMRAEVAASETPAEMAYDFARLTGELYFRAVWAKMAKVGDDEMQRLFARVQRRPLPVLV